MKEDNNSGNKDTGQEARDEEQHVYKINRENGEIHAVGQAFATRQITEYVTNGNMVTTYGGEVAVLAGKEV